MTDWELEACAVGHEGVFLVFDSLRSPRARSIGCLSWKLPRCLEPDPHRRERFYFRYWDPPRWYVVRDASLPFWIAGISDNIDRAVMVEADAR